MNSSNNKEEAPHTDGGRGGIAFGIAAEDDDYGSGSAGGNNNNNNMMTSLPTLEEERKLLGMDDDFDEDNDEGRMSSSAAASSSKNNSNVRDAEDAAASQNDDPFAQHRQSGSGLVNTRISDRESSYHARRHDRVIREDGMSYREAMEAANIDRERDELIREARKELIDE
ncbi:hypothetical protein ACHAWC_000226, partial [Mediolabrus comicus]